MVQQLLDCLKLHFPVEVLLWCVVLKCWSWLHSWWKHWQLASLIADWHRSEFKARMKKAGIHPRRSPVPAPLLALPCWWMVLSAIMLSMATVSLAGLVPPGSPPVTWVEAVGDVRSLWHPVLPRKRKPPDPILSEEEAAAFDSFKFITGCSGPMLQALESWDDLFTHVECHTASSFGPLGLLAKEDDGTAIVDTGASLTITPFKADFLTYEPQSGKVIKGLAQAQKPNNHHQ